jgi:hypothetical protein
VLAHVLSEVAFLGKRLVTSVALVRLFTHMHSYVVFKIPFFVKCFVSPCSHANDFLYLSAGFWIGDVFNFIWVNV